ncbi:MAG: 3-phosphoshikimate 1-carboxyvinyltransferase [Burkholderiaceae bacterium]
MSRGRALPGELVLAPVSSGAGSVALPGSKSISIRALLLSSLAEGTTRLTGVLDSDDTQVMLGALGNLGVAISDAGGGTIMITGAPEFTRQNAEIFVGNSGLSARTLLAALAFMPGQYRLFGVARMHERPIGDLVSALREVGADVLYLEKDGYLPLEVRSGKPGAVRTIAVRGSSSSQFLTGLLQAAPLLARSDDVLIQSEGELISKPYVVLTLEIMQRFGVSVQADLLSDAPSFRISKGATYRSPGEFHVEGDASSASYFLGLGALTGGPIRVLGVDRTSAQADIRFADVLEKMGATVTWGDGWVEVRSAGLKNGFRLRPIDMDLNHIPDAAMTLAVLALFAKGPSALRNIGSWRVKETDRIAAMACELSKLGARVEAGSDFLVVDPPLEFASASIRTYDDHRMAMAFSLAACGGVAITIEDPGCVAKTFPDYFDCFAEVTQREDTGA